MSGDRKPGKSLAARPGYEVGYAKPPKDTQFKPGQSGNPRVGRRGQETSVRVCMRSD